MKHLERFIELCLETWPDEPIGFDIIPLATGERGLQVRISRWLAPSIFRESDLNDPHSMIRTLKMSMDSWMPLKV